MAQQACSRMETPHPALRATFSHKGGRGRVEFAPVLGLSFSPSQRFRYRDDRQLALSRGIQRMAEQLRGAAIRAGLGRDVVAVEDQPAAGLDCFVEDAIDA